MSGGAPAALTGYPVGPAAPAAPGAPLSPPKPGFPGMPSCPLVPGTPCKAKKPLRPPKTQLWQDKLREIPVALVTSGSKGATSSSPHPCRCRTLLSPQPTLLSPHTHTGFGVFPAPQPPQGWNWPGVDTNVHPVGHHPSPARCSSALTGSPGSPRGPGSPVLPWGKRVVQQCVHGMGDQGDGSRVRLCSEKSSCLGTISAVPVLHQDRAQPAGSGTRVLPAPKMGFGMDPCCQESPTWEPGAPRGPGGPGRAWGTRAASVTQPWLSPLPAELQKFPMAKISYFPHSQPSRENLPGAFQGAGAAQSSSKQHLPLDQLFLEILVDLELPVLPVRRQEKFPFLCVF